MKTLMNHFCTFNDNLRKFLLVEADWVVISHLLLVVTLLSDHTFFSISFFFSFLSWSPISFLPSSLPFTFPPSSPFPPFFICMCYCKSPTQMEVYMPLLSQFWNRTQNRRRAAEYVWLFLQCHTLIPSNLFTDINANWENI